MRVPFVDLYPQSRLVMEDVAERWKLLIARAEFIGGPAVETFEREWAAYVGARYCVSCANGTDAIELAVRALGLRGPRSVAANTYIGTVEGMARGGCEPFVVDVDPRTMLADSPDVSVSLYGQHAAPGKIVDAAQAHGAERDGRKNLGVMCWSFYVTKPLGAWGDAGAVTTDDGDLAARIRALANHEGAHGQNSRMDALQAAVLSAKIPYLDDWNAQRSGAALYYNHLLEDLAVAERVVLPGRDMRSSHVWHLYVVRVRDRDGVLVRMRQAGVDVRVHYGATVADWNGWALAGHCERARTTCATVLSLPLWAGMSGAQQERVVETLIGALD